jgi:hypothetical protein
MIERMKSKQEDNEKKKKHKIATNFSGNPVH